MTREEIENIPKNINTLFDLRQKLDEKLNKVCELAIKTLEQELIFDKIRTEIKCMEYIEGSVNNSDEYEAAKEDALEIIDKYRQVEQEPRTGHWIKLDVWYSCSECSLTTNERGKNFYRYCPNCGCRMESEVSE